MLLRPGLLRPSRPRQAHVDPHWASVVLLLGCDGADEATTFTDESSAARGAATVVGGAQVDTAFRRFGTGAMLFPDGSNDGISFADDADFEFAAADWTVEGWFRWGTAVAAGTNQTFFSKWHTTGNQRSWRFFVSGATGAHRFEYSVDGTAEVTATEGTPTALVADTWYHIAAARSGTTLRTFQNGILRLTVDLTGITFFDSTAGFLVGLFDDTSGDLFGGNPGSIDEIRVTNGVARYTAAFHAPTRPHPRG